MFHIPNGNLKNDIFPLILKHALNIAVSLYDGMVYVNTASQVNHEKIFYNKHWKII